MSDIIDLQKYRELNVESREGEEKKPDDSAHLRAVREVIQNNVPEIFRLLTALLSAARH